MRLVGCMFLGAPIYILARMANANGIQAVLLEVSALMGVSILIAAIK